jgi:hypothetical protein
VAPNTIFTLGQPEPDVLELNLEEGQVWINVEDLEEGETFQVETPSAAASVRGTRYSVRLADNGGTIISTQAGSVTVMAAGSVVTVTPGHQTAVAPGDPPSHPVGMSNEEQLRWGMATGPELSVAVPWIGQADVFSYTGSIGSRSWSPHGEYYALYSYDAEGDYGMIYDVDTQSVITSPLPWETHAVFFNPTGGGSFSYRSIESDSEYYLCFAYMDGTSDSCYGGDARYGWPFWLSDGSGVVAYTDRDTAWELYLIYRDGSAMTRLTTGGSYAIRQTASPDNNYIAYVQADMYMGPGDLYVMGVDGSNPQLLFNDVYGNGYDHVDWSPDSSSIAVPQEGGGLYVVPVDGSTPHLMPGTENLMCRHPVWAPTTGGWPMIYYGYDPQTSVGGMWYTADMQSEPQYILYADWGPDWAANGSAAAFGFTDASGAEPITGVYVFQTDPSFWP